MHPITVIAYRQCILNVGESILTEAVSRYNIIYTTRVSHILYGLILMYCRCRRVIIIKLSIGLTVNDDVYLIIPFNLSQYVYLHIIMYI